MDAVSVGICVWTAGPGASVHVFGYVFFGFFEDPFRLVSVILLGREPAVLLPDIHPEK